MNSADRILDNCMYFTAARLHRALEGMASSCFSTLGLAPNQAFLLMTVQDRPGIAAGELARRLHLAPSTLTRFLDKLEARGLVKRTKEGRSASVETTAKGARIRPMLEAGWAELYRRYVAVLGEKAAASLTVAMVKAGSALEASDQ
jgi:DNA-binding MarR family transcriptional regulator